MGIPAALMNKIANAQTSKGGPRIKDGNYVFEVVALTFDQKNGGNTFVAELKTHFSESNGARGDADGNSGDPVEPNKVGTCPSFVCVLESTPSAAGNIKEFVETLATEEADFKEEWTRLVDNKSAVGMYIGAQTYRKQTKNGKNAGKWGCYPRWQRLDQAETAKLVTGKQ